MIMQIGGLTRTQRSRLLVTTGALRTASVSRSWFTAVIIDNRSRPVESDVDRR